MMFSLRQNCNEINIYINDRDQQYCISMLKMETYIHTYIED